jgi:hypothetical protein
MINTAAVTRPSAEPAIRLAQLPPLRTLAQVSD